MEHPDYRSNLELLNMLFPERVILSAPDIMQICGYKSRTTVYRNFGDYINKGRIAKTTLARLMCGRKWKR